MTSPQLPVSPLELKDIILSMVTVVGSVGASLVGTYAWVRAKFAANDVDITNIKERISKRDEASIRENSVISNELISMRIQNSKENEEIKKLVTDIRLNCVRHDGVLTRLDEVVHLAIVQKEIKKDQHG